MSTSVHRPTSAETNPGKMLKLVGGKLEMIRFGPPTPQRQRHASAPTRRGLYAFPNIPSVDLWYFATHRWDKLVPKRLRSQTIRDVVDDDDRNARWQARGQWIRDHQRMFRPVTFAFGGDVYARMDPSGRIIGHPDFAPDGWCLLSIEEYVAAAKRAVPGVDHVRAGRYTQSYSTDHLEVFIPSKV